MALRQGSPPPNPEDTGGVARAAFARGSLLLSLRDAFGTTFDDGRFAPLFQRLASRPRRPGVWRW
jgi:hypothetical protein